MELKEYDYYSYKGKKYMITSVHGEQDESHLMKTESGAWVPYVQYSLVVVYVNPEDPTDTYEKHSWKKSFVRSVEDFTSKFTHIPNEK